MNGLPGSPLTQVLVYASLFKCPEDIDVSIFEFLRQGTDFDVRVWFHGWFSSPIELAIELKRLDLAKIMVQCGANPIDPHISPDVKMTGVAQVFDEFFEFGTNMFLSWLLNTYLPGKDKLHDFIDQVIEIDILNEVGKEMFHKVGRNPVHAILTCQHEEMIKKFLQHSSDKGGTLSAKDGKGMSALQITAEKGDLKSVAILLSM